MQVLHGTTLVLHALGAAMPIRLICPQGGVLEACWEGESALTGGIFVVSALSKAVTCVSAATGMTMGTLVILRIPFSPYHPGGLAGAEKRASQVLGGRRRGFDGVPGRLGAERGAQPARAVPICLHAGIPAKNAWSSTLCDGERPITRGLGGRERAVAPKRPHPASTGAASQRFRGRALPCWIESTVPQNSERPLHAEWIRIASPTVSVRMGRQSLTQAAWNRS